MDLGVCGGTIIDPDHVITAAHCLCYKGTSDPVSVTSLAGVTIAVGTKYHLSKSMEECGKQVAVTVCFINIPAVELLITNFSLKVKSLTLPFVFSDTRDQKLQNT